MNRPLCKACRQRPCAINYHRDGRTHYRSRCEHCQRRKRGIRPPQPRWSLQGYRKKNQCDQCGFRARFSAQILVYHMDGRLTNCEPKNLRSVCQNCAVEVSRGDLPWRPGDLEPDR